MYKYKDIDKEDLIKEVKDICNKIRDKQDEVFNILNCLINDLNIKNSNTNEKSIECFKLIDKDINNLKK